VNLNECWHSELSSGLYCRVKWLSTDVSEVRTASIVIPDETSVDNHFTRQYNPEDSSEHHTRRRENLKSHECWRVISHYYCFFAHAFSRHIAQKGVMQFIKFHIKLIIKFHTYDFPYWHRNINRFYLMQLFFSKNEMCESLKIQLTKIFYALHMCTVRACMIQEHEK
jgi:hypothetical protein